MKVLCVGYFGDNERFTTCLKAIFPEVEFVEALYFVRAVWLAPSVDLIILSNILPVDGSFQDDLKLIKNGPKFRNVPDMFLRRILAVGAVEEKSGIFSWIVRCNSAIPIALVLVHECIIGEKLHNCSNESKYYRKAWCLREDDETIELVWSDIFDFIERELQKKAEGS